MILNDHVMWLFIYLFYFIFFGGGGGGECNLAKKYKSTY